MINVKGFKKVAEDKDTATLQHPKGHKITVIVSKLSPIEKEALKRLNMCAPELKEKNKENYAEGGKVKRKMYAEPDQPVSPTDNAPVAPDSSQVPAEPIAGAKLVGRAQNNPAAVAPVLEGEEAIQMKQGADTAQAKLDAQTMADQQLVLQNQNNQVAHNVQEMKGHIDDTLDTIDDDGNDIATIRPNAYFEDMSAPRKVGSAITMLLAGASGAGKNAMDFLNKQIDRNVQAQQNSFNNQNTIYHAYHELYGDETIAANMTAANNALMFANKINMNAKRVGTQQAMASAAAASAALNNKAAQELGMAATRRTAIQNGLAKPSSQQQPQQQGQPQQNSVVAPQGKSAEEEFADSPILDSNAAEALNGIRFGPLKDQYNDFKDSYASAKQADQVLSQLHDVHQQMFKDAQDAGSEGYIRRHNFIKELPFVGNAANEAVIKPMTDKPVNRDYEANKTRITSDVANALKGTNVSGAEIDDIVSKNSPEHGDDEKAVAQKERNLKIFIKNAIAKQAAKLGTQEGFLYKPKGK